MPLTNLRLNPFTLLQREVYLIGMAGPHNNSVTHLNLDEVFHELKHIHKIDLVIGLHEDSYHPENEKQIEYVHIPIPDFHTLTPPEEFDKIYERVSQGILEGKRIAIHCGSGNGRTGVALASLKLRSLLEFEFSKNSSFFDEMTEKNVQVNTSMHGLTSCTPIVKKAVELIRTQAISETKDNGLRSVERHQDVSSLLQYEEYLRNIMKQQQQQLLVPEEKAISEEVSKEIRFKKAFNNLLEISQGALSPDLFHVPHIIETPEQLETVVSEILSLMSQQKKCVLYGGPVLLVLAAVYMKIQKQGPREAVAFITEAFHDFKELTTSRVMDLLIDYYDKILCKDSIARKAFKRKIFDSAFNDRLKDSENVKGLKLEDVYCLPIIIRDSEDLERIVNNIVSLLDKGPCYLMGKTSMSLVFAAVHMKLNKKNPKEAISFVRQFYDPKAVKTEIEKNTLTVFYSRVIAEKTTLTTEDVSPKKSKEVIFKAAFKNLLISGPKDLEEVKPLQKEDFEFYDVPDILNLEKIEEIISDILIKISQQKKYYLEGNSSSTSLALVALYMTIHNKNADEAILFLQEFSDFQTLTESDIHFLNDFYSKSALIKKCSQNEKPFKIELELFPKSYEDSAPFSNYRTSFFVDEAFKKPPFKRAFNHLLELYQEENSIPKDRLFEVPQCIDTHKQLEPLVRNIVSMILQQKKCYLFGGTKDTMAIVFAAIYMELRDKNVKEAASFIREFYDSKAMTGPQVNILIDFYKEREGLRDEKNFFL